MLTRGGERLRGRCYPCSSRRYRHDHVPANSTSPDRSARPRRPRHIRIVGVPVVHRRKPVRRADHWDRRPCVRPGSWRACANSAMRSWTRVIYPRLRPFRSHPPHTPDRARNLGQIAAWSRALSRCTYDIARAGACPVLLGGDHSLSMGSVNGIARHAHAIGRELFVLWLDAHADFNTPATTLSGNMHGMSAALFAGEPGLEAVFGDEPACASSAAPPAHVRDPLCGSG